MTSVLRFRLVFLLLFCLGGQPALAQDDEILPAGGNAYDEALSALSSGLSFKERGDYSGAIRRFSHALNSGYLDHANRAIALNNRGNCYAEQEKWDEALADYNQSLLLAPEFLEAYFNRAGLYYQTGRLKEAVVDYRQAIAQNPSLPQPHYRLAFVWAKLGDYEQAVAAGEEALNLDPGNQRYLRQLEQWRREGQAVK
ncbi:MAG: tetratricopeptide repeat protein [Desulfarculales bacterium]|jgi:tetratricopeptide (TPR) repeat protein|nr:tetratricopeptide repeat protein [Desulfarculales bacterium]